MAVNKGRHQGVTENDEIVGVLSVSDLVHYFANPGLEPGSKITSNCKRNTLPI